MLAILIGLLASGRYRDEEGEVVAAGDDEALPEYLYSGVKADFYGVEAQDRIHLLDSPYGRFDLELSGDYTRAKNKDTGEALPRIAPLRLNSALLWELQQWQARVDVEYAADQNRVPENELRTDGYTTLGASLGYRFDLGTNANAFITPFARLQAYTANQNAFTETGAQSLNLSVAQQTTNSLRTVIGAQLGGSMDLGWREKLAMQLRLGWSHEYADVGRPVTAALAGAPAMPFTTWGVSPQRDGVVLGISANTAIAEATSIYMRYEGDISGQDSAHAITAGVRMTW